MRTTLKRGIGRAAGQNGNGHSAAPPLFGPATRYKQPEPPKRNVTGLLLRGVGWLVLAIAIVAAGVGGGIYLYGHETLNALNPTKGSTKKAEKYLHKLPSAHAPAIALIAGYDHRAGTGTNSYAGSNSDTLMLVRADPVNHTLSLLSFPRDLAVNIYCHGNTVYTQDRINAAWGECGTQGPGATVDTITHLTGLHINYLITLDFRAFKQVVNRLHGVYMNVDQRYYNPLHTGWSAINLQPGYQKLDGGQALSYVRFRHLDSDLYRNGRQQLFMEALKQRIRSSISLSNFMEIPQLIGALKGNLYVAKADGSPVSPTELESYLGLADHLSGGRLLRNSIPINDLVPFVTSGGADELQASPAVVHAAVQRFLHPNVNAAKQLGLPGSANKPHHKTTKTPNIPKKNISVLVLNAGNTPGAASNTTYLLTQQGFATHTLPATVPANAPSITGDSACYYDPVQPNAKAGAEELAPLFGAHTHVLPMNAGIVAFAQQAHNPMDVCAVGTSFSGTLKVPHKVKPHKLPPPEVNDGIPVVAGPVRALGRRIHFTPMVPDRIALGSQISSSEGVRLFHPLRGKQELALTFWVTGTYEYWQIEESNWGSAPILQSPTGSFVKHHTRYYVYTSGGAVQMVAVRTPKASYWVINTILNQLSNSTMLAIAESLHPLAR